MDTGQAYLSPRSSHIIIYVIHSKALPLSLQCITSLGISSFNYFYGLYKTYISNMDMKGNQILIQKAKYRVKKVPTKYEKPCVSVYGLLQLDSSLQAHLCIEVIF